MSEQARPLTSSGVCWSTIMVGLSDFMARLLGGFPNSPLPRCVPVAPKLPAFPGEFIAAFKVEIKNSKIHGCIERLKISWHNSKVILECSWDSLKCNV